MNIKEIQKMASAMGIKAGKMKKTELIRSIQTNEGNQACFQTKNTDCGQTACCWRQDCLTS